MRQEAASARVPLLDDIESNFDDHLPLDDEEYIDLTTERPKLRLSLRMQRADVALLFVIALATCYIGFYPPELRQDNPFWVSNNLQTGKDVTYGYITYENISTAKRQSGYRVQYTPRSFVIDGMHTLLLGGSIHYPRLTPDEWQDAVYKAKDDGLNHIQLYVFWNAHESTRGVLDFHDSLNLTKFYEVAASNGLFLHVRFGPYVCAEWNNGGLPLWLDEIPNMNVRSNNDAWKKEMKRFLSLFVELSRPYLATNGGPIVLAQIENELNSGDHEYIQWLGHVVQELRTGIPWIMCNGDAAEDTILACNGDDCVDFALEQDKAHSNQPFVWTEDEGWYTTWEQDPDDSHHNPNRSPQDMAYVITKWIARGGAHHNYYMYYGGNNYGRWAAAGVTTKYADGVNIHSDGLSNEPKRSHLRRLHESLIACNNILLSADRQLHHPVPLSNDSTLQQGFVYTSEEHGTVAFLENAATDPATIDFHGQSIHLSGQSVVIWRDGKIIYNTSDVSFSGSRVYTPLARDLTWQFWEEEWTSSRKTIVSNRPYEQLNVTRDETDYLIYETTFSLSTKASKVDVAFTSCDANAFLIYVNNVFQKEVHLGYQGHDCTREYHVQVPITSQDTKLSLLSVSLGIDSLGQKHRKGLTGDVSINRQSLITGSEWKMYPGLVGEQLSIYKPLYSDSVDWHSMLHQDKHQPLTWYKSTFAIQFPSEGSILLDLQGMTRGRAFINGHDLGRYWLIQQDGEEVQRYYNVPRSWLSQGTNLLVLIDELGGDTSTIQFVASSMQV